VVDELRRNARVPIQLDLPEGGILSSTLDPDAFAILLRNLIDNALKHGAAEQPVSVRLAPEGILRVINAGPVVPSEALPRLRSRFVRATSDVPGSGLGLAIVDRIAAGAGATLQICSPASGRTDGFDVVFDFHNTVIGRLQARPVRRRMPRLSRQLSRIMKLRTMQRMHRMIPDSCASTAMRRPPQRCRKNVRLRGKAGQCVFW